MCKKVCKKRVFFDTFSPPHPMLYIAKRWKLRLKQLHYAAFFLGKLNHSSKLMPDTFLIEQLSMPVARSGSGVIVSQETLSSMPPRRGRHYR